MRIILSFLCIYALFVNQILAQKINEEFVIFWQKNAESAFTQNNIKALTEHLDQKGFKYTLLDIEKTGAPAEVTFTPFIVYQNHLGRRIYKGRYTTHNRILNFARTMRFVEEKQRSYEKENVFVWENGKSKIYLDIKITKLNGVKKGYNAKAFMEEAYKGLKAGLTKYQLKEKATVTLSDETFYMNLYPYQSEDGKLYVSYELFSHYDCINPIFQQFNEVAAGDFATEKQQTIAKAAQIMQEEIVRQMHHSELGDALTPVPTTIQKETWESLSLPLPPKPTTSENKTQASTVNLPNNWVYDGAIMDGVPALQFHFPPPLHQYAGELKAIDGYLKLKKATVFDTKKAVFTVPIKSLTMGLPALDTAVHEKILNAALYPTATLTIKKITATDAALTIGKILHAQVQCNFTLVGKTIDVQAPVQIEVFLNKENDPRLHVITSFELNELMSIFNIEGPPGPSQASNTVVIDANFVMKPE